MASNVIVLSNLDAICLAADDAWREHRLKLGIKDPIQEKLAIHLNHIKERQNSDGSYTYVFNEESQKERQLIESWNKQIPAYEHLRDNWELDWIFEHEGYQMAAEFAYFKDSENNYLWDNFLLFRPCNNFNEELQGCSIFCENFENCCKEGFVKWSME